MSECASDEADAADADDEDDDLDAAVPDEIETLTRSPPFCSEVLSCPLIREGS